MRIAAALVALLLGAPLGAEGLRLDPLNRAALGAEIRAVLLSNPEILRRALDGPGMYDDDLDSDRATLAALQARLFGAHLPGFGDPAARAVMALLTGPDCPDCAAALAEAEALASTHPLRVTVVDVTAAADLLEALELDILPAYVFDGLIVRGHVPPVVLERYIRRSVGD